MPTHPDFRRKLEAIGFGVLIPVFFVTTGLRFDLDAILADASNFAMVSILLVALVLVRGLPALVYCRVIDGRSVAIAGLFQATSLPFIVAATTIGVELDLCGRRGKRGADRRGSAAGSGFPDDRRVPAAAGEN